MNCLIIDKNPKTRTAIEKFVSQTTSLRLLKSCLTAKDAASTLVENEVDLIFLDVKMTGMNAIEFINSINHNHSQLIIIADTHKFAKDAFDFHATDFLIQPLTWERFLAAVSKAQRLHYSTKVGLEAQENILFIKENGYYVRVELNNILYIKAMGDYVSVQCQEKKFVVKQTLKHVLGKLPLAKFFRIHLSYIVNVENIEKMDGKLLLTNGESIPYSRAYKQALIKKLNVL